MRIKYTAATGCPVGQFIVEAETDQERAILTSFTSSALYCEGWRFWRHGDTYSGDVQAVTSFNFGYVKRPGIVNRAERLAWLLHGWIAKARRTLGR